MKKTIFITGASRGFGKIWAEAFLKRGDQVIVTARNLRDIEHLTVEYGNAVLPLQLDVTNREQCFDTIQKGYEHFGKLDVVINNAGYGLIGAMEEISEQEARKQFDTNFFGTLWVTQAAIPIMRNQGIGHIVQVSSTLGLIAAPLLSVYSASKWAVEAISEAMNAELKGFGINTTIIEPGEFATGFSGASSAVHSKAISEYDELKAKLYADFASVEVGDPEATVGAILRIVDAEQPPLRILFGRALPWLKHVYNERLSLWEQWGEVSEATN